VTDAALRLDDYLEGLLADRAARPGPSPARASAWPPDKRVVDPQEARAADLLAHGLVRFHPSFRFEEALAARLRAAADAICLAAASGGSAAEGRLLAFPDPVTRVETLARERVPARNLLVGGAIASGVSLAGAAFLAWRRGHRLAPGSD
jgi:hypothetical protein